MFDELQDYINAANAVTADFDWKIERCKTSISEYEELLSNEEDSKNYYQSCVHEEKIRLEMYEAMRNAVIKIVKGAI